MKVGREQSPRARGFVASEERKRSPRVTIRIPVTLHFTEHGQAKSVAGHTVSVDDRGAMVSCRRSFAVNATLELQHKHAPQPQLCRVVRNPVESLEGFCVAVEFEAPAKDFWPISFPPVESKPAANLAPSVSSPTLPRFRRPSRGLA